MKNALTNNTPITMKQIRTITELCEKTGAELPNFEVLTQGLASQKIMQLERQVEKMSLYYATKRDMEHLSQMARNYELFHVIKEQLTTVPTDLIDKQEATLRLLDSLNEYDNLIPMQQEARDLGEAIEEMLNRELSADEMIKLDMLENKLDRLNAKITVLQRVDNTTIGTNKARLVDRLRKIDVLIANVEKLVINNYMDIENCMIQKDVVQSLIVKYEGEYQRWLKGRASEEQVKYLRQLHFRCNGSTTENMEYYTCLSKSQASKLIDQMRREQSYTYSVGDSVMASWYKGYKGDEYETRNGVKWEVEQDEDWNKMLGFIKSTLNYEVECMKEDLDTFKEIIGLMLEYYNIAQLSEQLQQRYTFTKEELEHLGLNISQQKLFDYEHNKQSKLTDLKNMLDLGFISLEDIQKAIQ